MLLTPGAQVQTLLKQQVMEKRDSLTMVQWCLEEELGRLPAVSYSQYFQCPPVPSGLWACARPRADLGEFKNWDCGNLMVSHCPPASHTQPNNSQEYHEGLKGWRKAVALGDCLILFPPVPPLILFHSWPYRQTDISMASRLPGRCGLESQVSSAYGSLEGAGDT